VEARFFLGRAFKYEMITRTRDPKSPTQAKLTPSEFFRFEAQAESECLCLGEVTLKDGTVIKLVSRWLDLETAPLLEVKQERDALRQEKTKEYISQFELQNHIDMRAVRQCDDSIAKDAIPRRIAQAKQYAQENNDEQIMAAVQKAEANFEELVNSQPKEDTPNP
jgi:hypothetical protein